MSSRWRTCAQCGIRRRITDPNGLCIDCRHGVIGLTGGSWVRRGATQVWEATPAPAPTTSTDDPTANSYRNCGTMAAYRRHLNEGRPTCIACRAARAAKAARSRTRKPRLPDFFVWDWPDLIEARRLHAIGDRTPWAIEGNRGYKREAKRRQRAAKNKQKEAA